MAIRDGAMSGGTHRRLEERERLAALRVEGLSLRGIARELGRAASTVSRELHRNALPRGGYLPVHAEGCYRERRQRPAILERDAKLARFVRERLLEGWTPEQIAGWLKRGEERQLRAVSCETIYAFVHRPGQRGEKLWKLLPRGRARRGRRRARPPRSTIAGRRSIHDRPAEVQERKDAGHWEGDLLICKRPRPVLVLKERKTRFVLAARLAGKSAAETVAVLMVVFRRLDPRLRSSITFDNDTAFARHGLLASACAMTTWFCDAYASWQTFNYPHRLFVARDGCRAVSDRTGWPHARWHLGGSGRCRWPATRMPGLIARSPDAGSPTSGWADGCVRCSSGWRARWAGASRSPARTGPTPRRPTASSPMTGSAKARSSVAISARRATGPPASVARSWCSTTRPSSPTGGGGPSGSARLAASTAARTSRAGTASTRSAGC